MREVRDKQRKTRKERGGGVRDGAEGGAESVCIKQNGSNTHNGGCRINIARVMERTKGFGRWIQDSVTYINRFTF